LVRIYRQNVSYNATLVGGNVNTAFSAPINSLIGVWEGSGVGIPFEMGASGSAVVPAGATELFLGSMDGYQWNNNLGSFQVTIPDGGLTAGFLGSALLGLGALRRKLSI
jgi:hypothetical protein